MTAVSRSSLSRFGFAFSAAVALGLLSVAPSRAAASAAAIAEVEAKIALQEKELENLAEAHRARLENLDSLKEGKIAELDVQAKQLKEEQDRKEEAAKKAAGAFDEAAAYGPASYYKEMFAAPSEPDNLGTRAKYRNIRRAAALDAQRSAFAQALEIAAQFSGTSDTDRQHWCFSQLGKVPQSKLEGMVQADVDNGACVGISDRLFRLMKCNTVLLDGTPKPDRVVQFGQCQIESLRALFDNVRLMALDLNVRALAAQAESSSLYPPENATPGNMDYAQYRVEGIESGLDTTTFDGMTKAFHTLFMAYPRADSGTTQAYDGKRKQFFEDTAAETASVTRNMLAKGTGQLAQLGEIIDALPGKLAESAEDTESVNGAWLTLLSVYREYDKIMQAYEELTALKAQYDAAEAMFYGTVPAQFDAASAQGGN